MYLPSIHFHMIDKLRYYLVRPIVAAVLIGGSIGLLCTLLWPALPGLIKVAVWLLGFSLGLLGVGLVSYHFRQKALWEMVLVGQLLGCLAIGLLFLASLMR